MSERAPILTDTDASAWLVITSQMIVLLSTATTFFGPHPKAEKLSILVESCKLRATFSAF